MPRLLHSHEPEVINSIENISNDASNGPIVFETGNEDKVKEIRRILKNFNIANKKLDIDEIQSLDPFQVVSKKAKEAWKQNNYNPIIVEDTSLEILALGNRPSTYVKDFLEDINIRRMICEEWLNGKDRRVVARVLLAVFDGKEVYI